MMLLLMLACLLVSLPVHAEDVYVTGRPLSSDEQDPRYSQLPPYLRYPNDALSEFMFGGKMKEVVSTTCNYKFMLYTEVADQTPVIEELTPPFDCNETHYYFKEDSKAWYSVSTMKHKSVRTNSVRSWVEKADALQLALGAHDLALRVPPSFRDREYRNVGMFYVEQNYLYNELHGFDESHLYCRIFYLGGQLYKKFLLVAKKDDWSWRVEENIPSRSEAIEPTDFVPAGQTFGRFYPVN